MSEGTTELAGVFRRLIDSHGPMPVSRYMGESNARYYTTRDPLGAPRESGGGDFTTAPEISQMFGEMAGLCSRTFGCGRGDRQIRSMSSLAQAVGR